MNGDWIYTLTYRNEYSSFMVTELLDIVEMDDCYNIILDSGELFLEKDKCTLGIDQIEYKDDVIEVYLERITPAGILLKAC